MMRRCIAILAALAACGAQHAVAANKCTLADGKVVYQDAPCAGGAASERVNLSGAGQAQPYSQGATYWLREAARIERANQVEAAIASRQVVLGMTANEALLSWGQPSKVNASIGAYGRKEQWVYRRGRVRADYVYVENGRVTDIQTSE